MEIERRTESNYKIIKGQKRTEDIFSEFEDLAKENKKSKAAKDTFQQLQKKFDNVDNEEDLIVEKVKYVQ